MALQCPLVSDGKCGMKAGQSRVKSGVNSRSAAIPKLNDSDSFLEIPKTHILAN